MPDNSVNYVTMMNFLEHLPSPQIAERAIDSAIRIASDFVFMLGPNFDHAHYLKKFAVRKYFSAWSGHTWEHTVQELRDIISKHKNCSCLLIENGRLEDTYSSILVPIKTPRNSGLYNPEVHGEKTFFKLNDAKVYAWTAFVVVKNKNLSPTDILFRALYGRDVRLPTVLFPFYSTI